MMNLPNNSDPEKYLIDLCYHRRAAIAPDYEKLKDINYIKQNQELLAKAIVLEYFKHRASNFLTNTIFIQRKDLAALYSYLYKKTQTYIKDIIRVADESGKHPKIKLGYLKTNNELQNVDNAINIAHKHLIKNQIQREKRLFKNGIAGTKEIISFIDNKSKIVLLSSQDALRYEGEKMGHCLTSDKCISEYLKTTTQIYSFRNFNNNPYVTIEVRNNKIAQCKGRQDKPPIKKYIPYIQDFIKAMGFELNGDFFNVGLIQDKYGTLHNIFDIPDEGIEIDGDLNLARCNFADKQIKFGKIKLNGKLTLRMAQNLQKDLDFSNINSVNLSYCNVKNCDIKPPKKSFNLGNSYGFEGVLDYSTIDDVNLENCDFTNVKSIILPPSFDKSKHRWISKIPSSISIEISDQKKIITNVIILQEVAKQNF